MQELADEVRNRMSFGCEHYCREDPVWELTNCFKQLRCLGRIIRQRGYKCIAQSERIEKKQQERGFIFCYLVNHDTGVGHAFALGKLNSADAYWTVLDAFEDQWQFKPRTHVTSISSFASFACLTPYAQVQALNLWNLMPDVKFNEHRYSFRWDHFFLSQ